MSRFRRILLLTGVAAAGLVTVAIAAEAAYRLRQRLVDAPPQIRYYHHERLSRAPVRDVDYDGGVRINRFGMRGPDFELRKPPGTTRVLVVGPSTAFDPCVAGDEHTWPARLEHWLEELADGRDFEVLNAGGLPLLDQFIRLQTEYWRFQPDAIVLYAGHGIVSAGDARPPAFDEAKPHEATSAAPWDAWLREHSRLYGWLRPVAPKPPAVDGDVDWQRAVSRKADAFARDLTSFGLVARSFGARVVFVELNLVTGTRPPGSFTPAERAAWRRTFPTPPDVLYEGYRRFQNVGKKVADSVGATYLPADQIAVTGWEHYCAGDAIHFNRAGSNLLARRLARHLLTNEVL